MEEERKPIRIVITKYYLLAWLFGLMGLMLFYLEFNLFFFLSFFICMCYSVADANFDIDQELGGDGPSAA